MSWSQCPHIQGPAFPLASFDEALLCATLESTDEDTLVLSSKIISAYGDLRVWKGGFTK
jgi:hypothetical protein